MGRDLDGFTTQDLAEEIARRHPDVWVPPPFTTEGGGLKPLPPARWIWAFWIVTGLVAGMVLR